jgi:hypothetical protein
MTDEELITRLNNLFWLLEDEGYHTMASNVKFAANRIEAHAAEIERLAKDKRWIIDERDRTFALMLSRAEKAEAEIERLRGDLKRAVEALGEIATDEHPLGWIAITALVELTGGKDDKCQD